MTEKADRWQYFQSQFRQLAGEEEQIEGAYREDRLLGAHCDYRDHPAILHKKGKPEYQHSSLLNPSETGVWVFRGSVSDNFQARFRALASRAGIALGRPKSTLPEDFWLHRLYLDMLENNSDQLVGSKEGGTIVRVCVASATFCARLERQALEQSEGGDSKSATAAFDGERQSFVQRILDKKGWSTNRLAVEAGLDFHTVNDYLKGKTRSNRSTRKQLADALVIAVEELPE
jgi:lambda repressor-like predicted transcriptional regulator